jgi:glycosyltransferase involved in cell wall biosynthesis
VTRPRIVFVLSALTMGGAEAQLATVFEGDPGRRAEYDLTLLVLSTAAHPLVVARFERMGVRIVTLDREALRFPVFLARLVATLRGLRPHAVHAMLAGTPSTWGRLAAKLAGVPRVLFSDLSLKPRVSRIQRTLDPYLDRVTDAFLPNAQAIAARLLARGARPERVHVVRNGIDLERFDPERVVSARSTWGVDDAALVVGFLGMLRREKRADLFVSALLALPVDRRPDLAVVAGDGPLMADVRAQVDADDWARTHVRLLGVVGDVPAFLAGIDFLVLSSDTEGLPNAVIEALVMGRPVVATAVSDVPELVGAAGTLVPPGDIGALAAAIAAMASEGPAARAARGALGRASATARFALPAATAAFWDVHDLVLRGVAR